MGVLRKRGSRIRMGAAAARKRVGGAAAFR